MLQLPTNPPDQPPDEGDNTYTRIRNIFSLIFKSDFVHGELQIKPSSFMKEMQMTTEERNDLMRRLPDFTLHKRPTAFRVSPEVITYQNFTIGDVYTVPLSLTNISNVSKTLQPFMVETSQFSLQTTNDRCGCKIAPGLKCVIDVQFAPEQYGDFVHSMKFTTQEECFEIPIVAIGPRPLLDLPDRITLPKTAINIQTERTILVRNIGHFPSRFSMETGEHFSIKNNRDSLNPNELFQLTIYFLPTSLGLISGQLKITYESGETLFVDLEGQCEEAKVNLTIQTVRFQNTYLGLSSECVVTLRNDSPYLIDYYWTSHECKHCERRARSAIKERFDDMKEYVLMRDNALVYNDIVDQEMNEEIYERMTDEEKMLCDQSEFLYHNSQFKIVPSSGQLWPDTTINFSVIFLPEKVADHESLAYLSINGCLNRFPLNMNASCIGPKVVLNVEEIEAQNIYIGSIHNYEVSFHNIGAIPATISYLRHDTEFGGEFICTNDNFIVHPEEVVSLYMEFTSLTRGRLVEKVEFQIAESDEILSFLFSGNVVCPLLNFDVSELDFGDISVGVVKTFELNLENNTQVSISYEIRILELNRPFEMDCPEFSCSSRDGVVNPYTKIPFSVTVNPLNAIQKMAEIALYMWGAKQTSRTVYMKYSAHVPPIICQSPVVAIKGMFITQTYYRTITLENKSDYEGNLTMRTMSDDDEYLMISLDITEEFVQPGALAHIRLSVRTDVIGDMKAKVIGMFKGTGLSFAICDVFVNSRGPCLDTDLADVNIGKVKTLTLIEHPFTVSNDSPIAATVTVNISGSHVTASDPVICLKPESYLETSLRIYGATAGKFRTMVKLEIEGTDPDCVHITGEFVGGSISTQPKLVPEFDLGPISTMCTYTQNVEFINEGKISHVLSFRELKTEIKADSEISTTSKYENPFFTISENQFTVNAGNSYLIQIECFSRVPCKVKTRYACNARKRSKRNLITKKIFEFTLTASFELPRVTLSANYMEFRMDIGVEERRSVDEDNLMLMNQSNVPLFMDITVDEPFHFFNNENLTLHENITLQPGEEFQMTVKFTPEILARKIQVKTGVMRIQYNYNPVMDKIPLIGIVNFPNVAFDPPFLDFDSIVVGHTMSRLVMLYNMSPLQVEYEFEINEDNFMMFPIVLDTKSIPSLPRTESYDSIAPISSIIDETNDSSEVIQCISADATIGEESEISKISTPILNSEDCLELAQTMLEDEALGKELQTILNPLVRNVKWRNEVTMPAEDLLPLETIPNIDSKKLMLDIVPRSGILAPFEMHMISVRVTPPPKTEMIASIGCNVKGGASTDLDIFAKSGNIVYHLKTDVCDFGCIDFDHVAETTFSIGNPGYLKFAFAVRHSSGQLCGSDEFEPVPGWLNLTPAEGIISGGSTVEIHVLFFPGIPGYFETYVYLEIAFFDPIKITIQGCGILPQYTFAFPRAFPMDMIPLCYLAIADISYPKHMNCTEAFTTQQKPDCEDWVYVRYKRHYPSAKDIEMAIERRIIRQHLEKKPELVRSNYENRMALIPDVVLPPYVIDLGFVVLNSTIETALIASKYADAKQKLVWARLSRKCNELGFSIVYEKGQPGPFLIFKPTHKIFPVPNTEVNVHITAIVVHNMKIDFEIRAAITVPSLTFKHSVVDFGKVQCGFCLRKPVFLYNDGVVTCSFKCFIQSTSNRPSNIFFTKSRDGTVAAGKFSVIEIYFQPHCHTKYDWRLVVTIEANKQPMKITLKGYGIMPELEISEDHIYFEPTLPYAIRNVQQFKIRNKSQVPIEICFTDFDKDFDDEAIIVRTLLNYFNVKKMLIPPRQVGRLPIELINLYNALVEALKSFLKERIHSEYMLILEKCKDRNAQMELNTVDIPDPLKDRSDNDVQLLFQENVNDIKLDHIPGMNLTRKSSMVLIESIEDNVSVDETSTAVREGVLIIFHGTPKTDYLFAANKSAGLLKMPVKNVDSLIIEALIRGELLAAVNVYQTIMKVFDDVAKPADWSVPDHYDEFELIKSQMDLIQAACLQSRTDLRLKRSTTSMKERESRPGTQEDSIQGTASDHDTFLNIPLKFLYDLLENSLQKYPGGLIIESLNSLFIKQAHVALLGLLKGVGNIRYIHQIYFSLQIDMYRKYKDKQNAELDKSENMMILTKLVHYTTSEMETMTSTERNIFSQYLTDRKRDSLQRRHARSLRLKSSQLTAKTSSKKELKISQTGVHKASISSLDKLLTPVSETESELKVIQSEAEAKLIAHICENWHKVDLDVIKPLPTFKEAEKEKVPKKGQPVKSNEKRKSKEEKGEHGLAENKMLDHDHVTVKTLTVDEIEERKNLGITAWFINSGPMNGPKNDLPFYELIPILLSQNDELQEALFLAQLCLLEGIGTMERLYSVLTEPRFESTKTLSNEFVIYDAESTASEMCEGSSMEDVKSSVTRKSSSSLRKSILLVAGNTKRKRKPVSRVVSIIEKNLQARRILQPDEVRNYEVYFFPNNCGVFSNFYTIQMVTMPMTYKIYVEGKADIPHFYMTPNMIFSKVLPEQAGHDLSIAYFEKEDVLHLGAIAAQSADSRIECLIAEDKLHLVNDSFLPCLIHVDFIDSQNDFSLYADNVLILSNNSNFLTLRGHPVTPGKIYTSMIITTQNNPCVNCVKLSSIGTNFAIEITPKDVVFRRVLIDKRVQIGVELKNQSLIGSFWEIDVRDMDEAYEISDTSGYLRPLGSKIVKFTFVATSYDVQPRRNLPIKFYDKYQHCGKPILEETIHLSAEIVNVEIGYNTEVSLGDIKIGQVLTEMYAITNRSQFDLKYCFDPLVTDQVNEIRIIRNSVQMDPREGWIRANDTTNVAIQFKTNFPIEFKSVPVFKCTIYDPLINRNVVDFEISITGKVFSSLYKLCPSEEVIFSPQIVDTEVDKDIVLYNIGRYSFTYVILPEDERTRNVDAKMDGKLKRASTTKKLNAESDTEVAVKKNKVKHKFKARSTSTIESDHRRANKPTTLKQGIFTITPSSGVIQPKTEAYIRINCKPKKAGTYKEKIMFHISGVTGRLANGEILCLQGRACFPQLDFSNLKDIFKQHMIVDTFEDALCAKQIMMNSIFVLADKQFYFNATCLNSPKEALLKIRNTGEVGANVRAEVSGSNAFSVEPQQHYFDSYKYHCFTVYFKPTTLDKFFGVLKISVELSDEVLEIKLSGDGYLPSVKLIAPPFNEKTRQYELEFKAQFLNTSASRSIVLHNPGILDTKVIVGLIGEHGNTIVITPRELQPLDNFCAEDDKTDLNHLATVRVRPQHQQDVIVKFKPNKIGRLNFAIKLFVVDNPYESFTITCKAVGYMDDIIVDGLDSILNSDVPSQNRVNLDPDANFSQISYKLDFGCKPVCGLHKMTFKLKNTSSSIYKFRMDEKHSLNFTPAVGHLKPKACKDIIATYFSKEIIEYKHAPVFCELQRIRYVHEQHEDLSWDDRQNCFISYQPMKCSLTNISEAIDEESVDGRETEYRSEPEYIVLSESDISIRFEFSLTVDYCYYEIDSTSIDMPATVLFSSSKQPVTIRNPSPVPVNIKWIVDLSQLPRQSSMSFHAFRPHSSAIKSESGLSTCMPFQKAVPLTGEENFIPLERDIPDMSRTVSYGMNLFSTMNLEGRRTRFMPNECEPKPFSIEPEAAAIPPHGKHTFTFKFSPYVPYDFVFNVFGEISNLRPACEPLRITVFAESLLPLYHFKLDPSDYMVTRRGHRTTCGIDPEEGTSILEFEAIGFGTPISKSFTILNPTNESFTFRWERALKEQSVMLFQCENPEGTVGKDRVTDATFTFIAPSSGTFEMFYKFIIQEYNVNVMLLLVGHAREPCVYFENSGLTLRPTVLGIDVHETVPLKNDENMSLTFRVIPSSLYHEGRIQKISIQPVTGTLAPKSSTPIAIKFHPSKIGMFTFNIEFKVDRILNPVVLCINAICYKVEPILKLKREYTFVDMESDKDNIIQLPVIEPSHTEACVFVLGNSGKVGFYFNWVLTDQFTEDFVSLDLEPREAYVKPGNEIECVVSLKANKPLRKQKIVILLKVTYGPTFPICLVCTTCKLRILISETSHNFGACLAQKQATRSNLWTMEISNNGSTVQIAHFEKTHFDHLTVHYPKSIIVPKESIKVEFYFHPIKICAYKTIVNLILNAKIYPITITGCGVPMEVELLEITDKFLDFGPISLGKYLKKRVNIINKSKCAVSIYFDLYEKLPMFFKSTKKLEPDFESQEYKRSDTGIKKKSKDDDVDSKELLKDENKLKTSKDDSRGDVSSMSSLSKLSKRKSDFHKSKKRGDESQTIDPVEPLEAESQKALIKAALRIRPAKWIKLFPQQSTEFTITCLPSQRMSVFQEQIYCQVEDTVFPLCVVKASCVAADYKLLKSRISFGTAILGSSSTMNTKLVNSGDLGGKFKWTWITTTPVAFTIAPMEGYSTSGTCTDFTVQFQPPYIHCNFSSTARLVIENCKSTFDMEISGTCINLPSAIDTLRFCGPVREIYTRTFTVKNSTPDQWEIKPVLSGRYFHVTELIVIEPKSTYTGEVIYNPLTMTQPSKLHEGTLFLPLPEGQGVLYELIGESLKPNTAKIIEKTISSKTYNIVPLKLYNWMKITQQFTVVNQVDPSDSAKNVLYKLTGQSIVDVPPLTEKDYDWTIYTLNEGKVNFIVKFRNELTKEYILYELKLTIIKCSALDTISLHACARQVAEYILKLENPLGEPTVYKLKSNCSELHFIKEILVAPYTEIDVVIEFRPLYLMEEITVSFEAVSNTLGTFPYTFLLSASNAETEQMIKIKSPLGQKTIQYVYIYNPSDIHTEFSVKLESPEFSVEKPVIASAREKACIQIAYEPSEIGGVHSKLILQSPVLGLYNFPLYGVGTHPSPQGPFIVKNNFQTFIPFKNPFAIGMNFTYSTSCNSFVLNVASEFLKPRTSTKINISTEKRKNQMPNEFVAFETGRLLIKCDQEGPEDIEWIMYLQAEEPI